LAGLSLEWESIMKLDLSEIAAHLGKRIVYEIDEEPIVDAASGLRCVERIKGSLVFSNTGRTIDVRGKARTAVELECSRCLTSYRLPVVLAIEEELPLEGQPWASEEVQAEEELPEEEKEPLFVDNVLDLGEYLRQSILVNVPIKPLCKQTCKGLCPHCGANLNDGPCECPPDSTESPFGALASLLEDEEAS
jgi:uncharacterized protein